jgi:peptidoglycan/LPS O-acetylase OafA/YrhL
MTQNYHAVIDGLRTVAVVLVVAFHAFPNVAGGDTLVFVAIGAHLNTVIT